MDVSSSITAAILDKLAIRTVFLPEAWSENAHREAGTAALPVSDFLLPERPVHRFKGGNVICLTADEQQRDRTTKLVQHAASASAAMLIPLGSGLRYVCRGSFPRSLLRNKPDERCQGIVARRRLAIPHRPHFDSSTCQQGIRLRLALPARLKASGHNRRSGMSGLPARCPARHHRQYSDPG